ncbi:hypothetical protein [Botrimarina sp.]|uniref:hypothetical protein n=1 Tax=Botrimarina sp. TaxID=2795802 RepID=UPI0032EFE70B
MLISHDPTNLLTVRASGAYAPGLRVKWSSTPGRVELADDEACIGVTKTRSYATGERIVVYDIKSCGSLPFTAAGPIARGAGFTSTTGGKVASGAGGNEDYGIAMTAAGGDGAQFEGTSGR